MNADLKRRWVEALRSGQYEQGSIFLRGTDDRHCCLGVLCDLVNPDGWVYRDWEWHFEHEGHSNPFGLPHTVSEEIEFDDHDEGWLIRLNDAGTPFGVIADWIEANVEIDA